MKPLGGKAYGSIPHLPGSRLGPADHHCHPGQEAICTVKARDRHDRIIVMEKVDGACVSVANISGSIVALIRAGYTADSAHFEHLRHFGAWVAANPGRFKLEPGQRLVGEWIAMAHGTLYADLPPEPWIVFDAFVGKERLPLDEVFDIARRSDLTTVPVLSDGPPMSISAAMTAIGDSGGFGADGVEGAVWRVERKGEVDFLAKYVRPDKLDGCYLPEISGGSGIWNWQPPVPALTKG